LLFKNISVLNEDFSVSHDMDLRTDGSFITAIEKSKVDMANYEGRIIDGRGKLVMPGFYNAHTHTPMTLMRGYGEGLPLFDWFEKKILPFENELTKKDCYHAAMLAFAESFANGIVSSSDQYFCCEEIAKAAAESGAKLNLSRGLSFFGNVLNLAAFKPYKESEKLFREYHDTQDGRIRVEIGLHAEYTATQELIDAVAGLLKETGAPVHVHVSETLGEHEECKKRHRGKTPVKVLANSGVFENGGVAAHCVWIEDEDADIMKENGISVATCPVSNMKLASGIARIPFLLKKELRVALGTDGAASNNSLNFFESIKMLALTANVRFGDTTLIKPSDALFAATRAGALSQGRLDCGYVKEGFRADLIILDLKSPSINPVFEIASSLVYAASNRDIIITMVDGRVVYERGDFPTLDLEKTLYETERARVRILGELTGKLQ